MGGNTVTFTDNGCGMSPEVLRDVFAAYGESTKRHSDEQIGAFGLGCKTPFMLADTFTVTTTAAGVTTQGLFIRSNDEGMPEASFKRLDVDRPSGTCITIMVNEATDVVRLEAAVRSVAYWMASGTVILNEDPAPTYHDDAVVITGEALLRSGHGSSLNVVMGGITYPLNAGWVGGTNALITLFADVGDFMPTPQRDRIKDTEENRLTAKRLYDLGLASICSTMRGRIDDCGSLRDAAEQFFAHDSILKRLGIEPAWRGEAFQSEIDLSEAREQGVHVYVKRRGKSRYLVDKVYWSSDFVVLDGVDPAYKPMKVQQLLASRHGDGTLVYLPAGFVLEQSWLTLGGPGSFGETFTTADIDAVKMPSSGRAKVAMSYSVFHVTANGVGEEKVPATEVKGRSFYLGDVKAASSLVALGIVEGPIDVVVLDGNKQPGPLERRGATLTRLPDRDGIVAWFEANRDRLPVAPFLPEGEKTAWLAAAKHLPKDHPVSRRFKQTKLGLAGVNEHNLIYDFARAYPHLRLPLTDDLRDTYPMVPMTFGNTPDGPAIAAYIEMADAAAEAAKRTADAGHPHTTGTARPYLEVVAA